MSTLAQGLKKIFLSYSELSSKISQSSIVSMRFKSTKEKQIFVEVPKPGQGQAFRRIVHFPDEYTVQPLRVTNLGGRDPKTGRKVCEGIGGGIKHKYHWIKWLRDGPDQGPPQEEKVLRIMKCGCRTAHIALVAYQDKMKYILATENMKPGDIIKTSKFIPRNPVRPQEGDAYPLGALPLGTVVHNVQLDPSKEFTVIHSAGSFGVITKHLGSKIVVQLPSKQELALLPSCMATVGKDYFVVIVINHYLTCNLIFVQISGRLSNVIHSSIPIGSPNRARELGFRPRSGLWHRKKGIHGRKIKPLPPVKHYESPKPPMEFIRCTHEKFQL